MPQALSILASSRLGRIVAGEQSAERHQLQRVAEFFDGLDVRIDLAAAGAEGRQHLHVEMQNDPIESTAKSMRPASMS